MIESLLSGLLGGVLRIAPEVLKFFDRKNERAHELAMLDSEKEFAKLRGEINIREAEVTLSGKEIDAMAVALREQGDTARAAGWFVAALSALVRPLVTYWYVALYSAVKITAMVMAVAAGADWKEVLVQSWNDEDMAILTMLLSFWFVGRVWERKTRS
jgi:hypothetical protein